MGFNSGFKGLNCHSIYLSRARVYMEGKSWWDELPLAVVAGDAVVNIVLHFTHDRAIFV